jgi:AraC-type DNA-binding domain-containing proteins
VITSMRAEMRSLYVRREDCQWAPGQCRVLEVTPLARELIKSFCALPVDYPEGGSCEQRLVAVLLDQLASLPEVGFSLPLPRHERLLVLCNELIESPDAEANLSLWSDRLGMSEKTLMRLFQRETGLSFRSWRQRARLLSSLGCWRRAAMSRRRRCLAGMNQRRRLSRRLKRCSVLPRATCFVRVKSVLKTCCSSIIQIVCPLPVVSGLPYNE